MINKIAKISAGLYQLNNGETPLDEETLNNLIKDSAQLGMQEADTWYKNLEEKGENSFEDRYANIGTVVNMYEIESPELHSSNECKGPGRFFTEKELKEKAKEGWRETLKNV